MQWQLQYGKRHGYVSTNYFEGLRLAKSTRAKEERSPFSDTDLQRLFSSEIYLEGDYKQNFHYWIWFSGEHYRVTYDYATVTPGEKYTLDNDLIIWFTKELV